MRASSISESQPSSVAADRRFYVSFGLVISAELGDVDKIRQEVKRLGGKIIFECVSKGDLYLLREYHVHRALSGDVSHLREIHERKTAQRRDEKI